MKIDELIIKARAMNASDIHLSESMPLMLRINGTLTRVSFDLDDDTVRSMILELLSETDLDSYKKGSDVDMAFSTSDGNRQRINVFHQQGKMAATIRLLNSSVPSLDMLGLPAVLSKMINQPRGLILVTGPTGSGKSTTLASMIEEINSSRPEHIITIEDPIEYTYDQKLCLIHQRETDRDVKNFAYALRSALREDPDIILVGEMRDYETISAALTAAETGHLVLSTLHTTSAAQTIDRIIDVCPGTIQTQVRTQLSTVLNGVVTQCLIPNISGMGRVPATEILIGTDAVSNLIRENKCYQLNSIMQQSGSIGMHTLNNDLARLVRERKISKEMAYMYTNDKNDLEQYIQ